MNDVTCSTRDDHILPLLMDLSTYQGNKCGAYKQLTERRLRVHDASTSASEQPYPDLPRTRSAAVVARHSSRHTGVHTPEPAHLTSSLPPAFRSGFLLGRNEKGKSFDLCSDCSMSMVLIVHNMYVITS